MVRRFVVVFLVCAAGAVYAGGSEGPKVEFVQGDQRIDVKIEGNLFTSYRYETELTKPVLLPVMTPAGIQVNRNYPLTPGESKDHPHHIGLFFTYDKVNGEGFWNNTTSPPQIKHIRTERMDGGQGCGELQTVLHWVGKAGLTLLEERRTMTFFGEKDMRGIYFQIRLTAQDQPIVFEDTKEGMFALRVADWLSEKNGTGHYVNSEGQETEKNAWGRRARWVRLEGNKDGKPAGVAMFNFPGSINYPSYWHARAYGLFAIDPLGQFDFQKGTGEKNPKKFSLRLDPGMSGDFRFLVLIYDGTQTPGQLEKYFDRFNEK
jgi:hypothetical protein